MYIWLAVTPDELELPMAVADSARELGEIMGLSENAVRIRKHTGDGKDCRVVMVECKGPKKPKPDRREYFRRRYLEKKGVKG